MWIILRTPACWQRYQADTAQQLSITPGQIAWGKGPQEYPCLVTAYFPPTPPGQPQKMVCAYVYKADVDDYVKVLRDAGKLPAPHHIRPGSPEEEANFRRWDAALHLASIKALREVCCVKEARFEEWVLEALELIDEVQRGKRDRLAGHEKLVVDRLYPPALGP